ncbi:hypothetical protein C8R45DRAFT_941610 [Mycena sanguinolenta]|nr:hypothetical protein C8R45DRAFT_941610 [Mycena sanguinolenta]
MTVPAGDHVADHSRCRLIESSVSLSTSGLTPVELTESWATSVEIITQLTLRGLHSMQLREDDHFGDDDKHDNAMISHHASFVDFFKIPSRSYEFCNCFPVNISAGHVGGTGDKSGMELLPACPAGTDGRLQRVRETGRKWREKSPLESERETELENLKKEHQATVARTSETDQSDLGEDKGAE